MSKYALRACKQGSTKQVCVHISLVWVQYDVDMCAGRGPRLSAVRGGAWGVLCSACVCVLTALSAVLELLEVLVCHSPVPLYHACYGRLYRSLGGSGMCEFRSRCSPPVLWYQLLAVVLCISCTLIYVVPHCTGCTLFLLCFGCSFLPMWGAFCTLTCPVQHCDPPCAAGLRA